MKFKSSLSARNKIQELTQCFPENVEKWIKGETLEDKGVPNIYHHLFRFDRSLSSIKNCHEVKICLPEIVEIGPTSQKDTLNHDLVFLLGHCSFWLVTEKDIGSEIEVKNIFTDKEARIKVLVPNNFDSIIDRLAYYTPETGSIVLFVDRILNFDNPYLDFQHVLLHEVIHAMLDLNSRIIINEESTHILNNNVLYASQEEECLDNVIILSLYDNVIIPNNVYHKICEFISKEPPSYSRAVKRYEVNYRKNGKLLFSDIKDFLEEKIQWSPRELLNIIS